MYRLETFGKLALSGGSAGALSHQRRRLALLALLAASGERGMSRDQLLAYLWPESSAENGRHSLEQLLHALRRSLGESVFSGVNPVRLDADVVASDVNEFERALQRGAFTDAVALYGGSFLQGFYLNDAPEFERWTSTERARLADRYTEALNRLAVDAERAGDHAAAVSLRRRIADVDPVSSRSALALMRALVAAGDRTAALQHARIYEALVQQELDSAPDPSIVKYAATLREEVDQGADLRESTVSKSAPLALDAPVRDAVPAEAVHEVQAPRAPVSPVPRTSARADFSETTVDAGTRRRRSYWLPAAIFVGIAALLFAALTRRDNAKMPALDSNKIVIVPFRTAGVDSSLKYLGEGIVDLIAPMLTGEGGPVAVDSRTAISTWNRITRDRDGTAADAQQVARELGAGVVLSGAIVATGGRLTITGNVISGKTGETRPLTSVSAPADSVDRLVDLFVAQLLTRQSGVAEASVSAVTSQSLPAIRAYLNGRAAYRRADEDQAIASFTRALDIDSTFALAALDLAIATGKMMRQRICRGETCRVYSTVPGFAVSGRLDDAFNRGVRVAWEQRSKLGRRDRPLLDALRGDSYPAASSSQATLANLRRAVAAAPDRPETHYLLGVILLYQGRALELPDARASADRAFRQAVKLDSSYLAPLARMVDLAAFAGDTATLRRASTRYLSRDSVGPTADYVRWILAAGTGDIAGHSVIRSRLRSLDSRTLEQIFVTSQMTGVALEDADTASSIIIENAADPLDKSVAFRRAELLALNRGRPSAAATFLRNMQDLRSPSFQFENFSISAAIFNDGDRAVADSAAATVSRRLARDTLHIQPTEAVAQRRNTGMVLLALWHLYTGDTARARRPIEWLRRQRKDARNPALFVLPEMLVTSRARRADGAALRSLVDSVTLQGCCFAEFVVPLLAQSYEASGDDAGALRVVRRGKWFWPPRNLSSLLREEGRLSARLGDRAGAIRAYEHYLALRSDPEPVLRPESNRIRAELNRLKRGR